MGLELRPRRLREAAAIWAGLTAARGVDGRDAMWAHPDLLPTADDLDDPEGFVRGGPELDIPDLEADLGSAGPQGSEPPGGPVGPGGPEGPGKFEGPGGPEGPGKSEGPGGPEGPGKSEGPTSPRD